MTVKTTSAPAGISLLPDRRRLALRLALVAGVLGGLRRAGRPVVEGLDGCEPLERLRADLARLRVFGRLHAWAVVRPLLARTGSDVA